MAGNNSIQFLRGPKANISSSSEVALAGQPVFATDTNELFIGDGSTAIRNLEAIGVDTSSGVKVQTVTVNFPNNSSPPVNCVYMNSDGVWVLHAGDGSSFSAAAGSLIFAFMPYGGRTSYTVTVAGDGSSSCTGAFIINLHDMGEYASGSSASSFSDTFTCDQSVGMALCICLGQNLIGDSEVTITIAN